jgi:small conductance mechanosensitive channel
MNSLFGLSVFADSTASSVASGTATASSTPSSIGEWFQKLWATIVNFFVNGTIDSTGTSLFARILIALVLFFVLFYLDKLVIWILRRTMRISKEKDTSKHMAKSFLLSVIKSMLMVILVVIIMAVLGFDMSGLSTIISSAIVAIGLSLQNVIANFASGIIIISSKHLLIGDYISVGTTSGTIRNVNILDTELVTPDNTVIYIPNSIITSTAVTDYNTMKYRLINLTISASYGTDIDAVKKVLKFCVLKNESVIKDMPITVVLKSLSDSSLDFAVRCYVPNSIYWDVLYALQESIYKELDKRNIWIPYNKMDVNLYTKAEQEELSVEKGGVKADDISEEDLKVSSALKDPVVSRDDKPDEIDSLIDKAKQKSKKKPPFLAKDKEKDSKK